MQSALKLNYKEKVLLYLRDYMNIEEEKELPEDITQQGISEGVDMSRTHSSRMTKELVNEGYLRENISPVKDHNRKLKTYLLTKKGIDRSDEIYDELTKSQIPVIYGEETKKIKISQFIDEGDRCSSLLDIVNIIEREGLPVDSNLLEIEETIKNLDETIDYDKLVNRKRVLSELKNWLKSDEPVGVLLGRRGMGTSTAASAFVKECGWHTLWISVNKRPLDKVIEKLKNFIKKVSEKNINEDISDFVDFMKKIKFLLVLDDYYNVDDDLVDFLDTIMKNINKNSKIKILVTSRKGMPVYERFYKIQDVEQAKVKEIEVEPFDREDTQNMLEVNLERGALDRIMLMTKGSPMLLKLLKEGKKDKLFDVSTLSKEQISLLMFLKTKTC